MNSPKKIQQLWCGTPRAEDLQTLSRRRVAIVGQGNIGSHIPLLLARMQVGSLLLIDRGRLETKNLVNQSYGGTTSIGRPKVDVMAEQIQAINSDISVETVMADIEDVPVGRLADQDLILGALDSLHARQVLANERAYRLSRPYIDGGVDALGDWVGKVQVIVPAGACLECPWGEPQYRHVAREMPCHPRGESTGPPTLAPSLVGAAIANIMVAEALKILAGNMPSQSFEITIDLASRRWLTSRMTRASRCRFNHGVVTATVPLRLPYELATIGDLLAVVRDHFQSADDAIQFEFRRGLVETKWYSGQRHCTDTQLSPMSGHQLADLGFSVDDYILAEHRHRHVLVTLRPPYNA